MITREYLEYLDDQFPLLGTGVSLKKKAEECAKHNRETGFSPDADPENYNDQYQWATRSNPHLEHFESWHFPGEKVWPSNLQLTPTVLKHWYCGDGTYNGCGSNNYISIALFNERHNKPKVERYFSNGPGVSISSWNGYGRVEDGVCCQAQFTVEDSMTLFQYMGDPLPGFEYKWPESF